MRTRISRHLGPVLASAPAPVAARAAKPDRAVRPVRPGRLVLDAAGQVVVPPEFSGRDYAIFLLRIAAEVEHSLMAQYLFAAYSLGGPDVPDDAARTTCAPGRRPSSASPRRRWAI